MPSPLAHAGVALCLYAALQPRGGRPWDLAGLCVALASVAPDLDIAAVAVLPGGLAWHRGPSHSLLGAALLGLSIAAIGGHRRRWSLLTRAAIVAAAVLHVPLDWSTGVPGAPSSLGVPWAWPFDAAKAIDPRPWFGAYHIDRPGFLSNMIAPDALPVYGREAGTVAIAGLVAVAIRVIRARHTRSREP